MFSLNRFRSLLAGAVLSVFASATAFAQTTILVVDTGKVYNDSQVGQHIERQIESMMNTTRTQLQQQGKPLATRAESLRTQVSGKTPEQVAANTALRSQLEQQQRDQMKLQQDASVAQQEIQMAKLKAVQLVDAKVSAIIKKIVDERNADIVIDRQYLIYGEPADITPTVLSRLNAEMKTVPVVRQKLPANSN